jgi:hypothetical protein
MDRPQQAAQATSRSARAAHGSPRGTSRSARAAHGSPRGTSPLARCARGTLWPLTRTAYVCEHAMPCYRASHARRYARQPHGATIAKLPAARPRCSRLPPHCTVRPWSQPAVKTHARTVVTGTLQLQHHHDLLEQLDGIRLHVVHADQPSDRFETKWCSRKNKVRALPRPETQHHCHASADSSQGSLLPHSSAYWDFQWMFPHWNSSCSFGRHSG